MKLCSNCNEQKQEEAFNKKEASKDGLQPHCRECSQTRSRKYYSDNREHHQKNVRVNTERYVERNRRWVWGILLSSSCKDCGDSDPMILEFDHLGDKVAGISSLIQLPSSLENLQKEINKCDIVCANCHRRRTYSRNHSYRWLYMNELTD